MTSFHAEKCYHLVSGHAASARRLYAAAPASSWSLVLLYFFVHSRHNEITQVACIFATSYWHILSLRAWQVRTWHCFVRLELDWSHARSYFVTSHPLREVSRRVPSPANTRRSASDHWDHVACTCLWFTHESRLWDNLLLLIKMFVFRSRDSIRIHKCRYEQPQHVGRQELTHLALWISSILYLYLEINYGVGGSWLKAKATKKQ